MDKIDIVMRKLICSIILAVIWLTSFAQDSNDGTLKFLGIPIDGTKAQMIEKIKAKGFKYNSYYDRLTGQFNGKTVDVSVVDNHGTVYRIFVAFPKNSEYLIRSEFNHLLSQFMQSDKYLHIEGDEIAQTDNIAYEIMVNNKVYGASFAYISPDLFTREQSEKLHQAVEQSKTMSDEEVKNLSESLAGALSDESSKEDIVAALNRVMSILNGNVWFKLFYDGGDYQIYLYYDNLKNKPNGEDL